VGDALAFSAPTEEGDEQSVLLVQCRETNLTARHNLQRRLVALLRMEMSLDCTVELVSNNSLPKTSSGKLSRAKARLNFIALHSNDTAEKVPLQAGNA